MARERIINAAGGVVWRKRTGTSTNDRGPNPSLEVLAIHRPAYDDWTFPKGKVDPDEALPVTAVREIAEETGLDVRLGVPLTRVSYPVAAGTKVVDYWSARQVRPAEAPPFRPNREVDELRWVSPRAARDLLTYEHDLAVLDAFDATREHRGHRTRTLVVLRHGKAEPRGTVDDDLERPLAPRGAEQASALVPLLRAYGVRRVVSSPAVRCAATVEPYAQAIGTFLQIDDRLSEDTGPGRVERSVRALMDRKKPVVLCSHRPTLAWIFDAIGTDVVELAPGEAVVVHHRKGAVVATEKLP